MNRLAQKIQAITFLGLALIAFQSCSEDSMSGDGETMTSAELQTILMTDDIAGAADSALAELYMGDTAKSFTAKENDCYTAEYSETGFVATFNNCVLNGTENVDGTVAVTYEVGEGSASFTATFTDFYVGTIKINGTRTFVVNTSTDQSSVSFTVTSDMSIELEDGTTISETGEKTFGIDFSEDLSSVTFTLSGNWTVQIDEDVYAVETLEDLQVTSPCEYVSSGSMVVSKNGLAVTVDFGNGQCDDEATLIYPNGASEVITLE